MQKIELNVSAEVLARIQRRCELFGCTVQEYMLNHIFDHLLDHDEVVEASSYQDLVEAVGGENVGRPMTQFDAAREFPNSSHHSQMWAQAFIDKALSYPGVSAFKSGPQSVGFDPQSFVYIERVYTEDDGFAASFYGRLTEHQPINPYATIGRTTSYTRAKVRSQEQLFYALKSLDLAKRLR